MLLSDNIDRKFCLKTASTPMRHELPEDITSLVKLVSVHRRIYNDPAIFERELERIFGAPGSMSGTRAR